MSLDFKVSVVGGDDLREALKLLEGSLREGKPVSDAFVARLRRAVEAGEIEVLAARAEETVLGVGVVAYRLNVSAGATFASIEDLYVRPGDRRRGVGRALLEAVGERCARWGVSYVEVQVEEEQAREFYGVLGYGLEPEVRVMARSYAL
jgi:GNAT superfamily N-acetyltransferase